MTDATKNKLLDEVLSYEDFQEFLDKHCELVLPFTKNMNLFHAVRKELGLTRVMDIMTGTKVAGESYVLTTDGKHYILSTSIILSGCIYQRKDFVQLVECEFKDKAYQLPLELLEAVLILERDHAAEWLKNLKRL